MDGKHPKRRRDKYNPYTIMQKEGRYFLSFMDGESALHNIEVDQLLYNHFNSVELEDISYLNVWDRHIEQSELTEATLNRRTANKNVSMEEIVMYSTQIELLHRSISELPTLQRRRLILYFFFELTYEQIAELEGCTKMPIKRSVDRAITELRKKMIG